MVNRSVRTVFLLTRDAGQELDALAVPAARQADDLDARRERRVVRERVVERALVQHPEAHRHPDHQVCKTNRNMVSPRSGLRIIKPFLGDTVLLSSWFNKFVSIKRTRL